MSSTHSCLRYHLVFSTKGRRLWIQDSWETRLYRYLGGIIRELGGVAEAIGGVADHVHLLANLKPTHCLADVLREIKSGSSRWIHDEVHNRMFGWQDGYGAFTVGSSEVANRIWFKISLKSASPSPNFTNICSGGHNRVSYL